MHHHGFGVHGPQGADVALASRDFGPFHPHGIGMFRSQQSGTQ
jgi:hypothetical protein